MKIVETELDGVVVIEPDVFGDERGYFLETYNQDRYQEFGIKADFVQDNMSFSTKGTLRGLHFQHPHGQAKLVQVLQGEIFDVVVDIRKGSPAFGRWFSEYLSDTNKKQIFIPEGFAHGFCVLSDTAIFQYKCSDFYAPECEGGILWSDPDLAINWPMEALVVSKKDAKFSYLKDIAEDILPSYK
jgi:dTDP-4-dehydrorhamnose 3,5-epimerase